MVDAKKDVLEITVAGKDFEISQSPGLLQSKRSGGTTGAAVWQASVRFAEWAGSPNNVLFQSSILDANSAVLELGAGISGVLPCVLGPRVRKYIASDQLYILKALQDNIAANIRASAQQRKTKADASTNNLTVLALDWEADDVPRTLQAHGVGDGVDMVCVCDCIYNYALIKPLVHTCASICELRKSDVDRGSSPPTMCIIAQQLRQPDVFEEWLAEFHQRFQVWRLPDHMVIDELKEGSGFSIHIGILRSDYHSG